MENRQDTYQGGKKKALWQVSITAKTGSTRAEYINVLADSKAAAKRHERVDAELKTMGLTRQTATIGAEETCHVE